GRLPLRVRSPAPAGAVGPHCRAPRVPRSWRPPEPVSSGAGWPGPARTTRLPATRPGAPPARRAPGARRAAAATARAGARAAARRAPAAPRRGTGPAGRAPPAGRPVAARAAATRRPARRRPAAGTASLRAAAGRSAARRRETPLFVALPFGHAFLFVVPAHVHVRHF